MHDVIVVGGGFAGVTAAREAARRGRDAAPRGARPARRTHLDGRGTTTTSSSAAAGCTGTSRTRGRRSLRAGLAVELGDDADERWLVRRRRAPPGTIAERDAIAERGWDPFVDGVDEALPQPYDPLARCRRGSRASTARRSPSGIDELDLDRRGARRPRRRARVRRPRPARRRRRASASLRWHALSGGTSH